MSKDEVFRITHLGAEIGVTGSCHLVQARGLNILVDCGMAQGTDTVLPIDYLACSAFGYRFCLSDPCPY